MNQVPTAMASASASASASDDAGTGTTRIGTFAAVVMSEDYYRDRPTTEARATVFKALNDAYQMLETRTESLSVDKSELFIYLGILECSLQLALFTGNESLLTQDPPKRTVATLAAAFYGFIFHFHEQIRVRDTEFGILSTELIWGAYEMKSLAIHVRALFDWHEDQRQYRRPKYAAPYKPIIQSSGTGKTKILHEFCRSNDVQMRSFFISCVSRDSVRGNNTDIYDKYLSRADVKNLSDTLATFLETQSLQPPESGEPIKVLLVLDEAQQLSAGNASGIHALRKFLRHKRNNMWVVALIAGTTTCLANCYPPEEKRSSSREAENDQDYHTSGNCLYGPIFELYTMGCYAEKISFHDDYEATELDEAVPYGRPLFARMLFAETSEDQYPVRAAFKIGKDERARIATRMLLGTEDPFGVGRDLLPFISVWATRVQLGCTQAAVIDELVAKGYAHLTGFSVPGKVMEDEAGAADDGRLPRPTASFSYLPDPVCAHLAMQFMNENWSLKATDGRSFKGSPKKEWIAKLKQLFSCGVCRPPRGDLGEILCATYLLFCADDIRSDSENFSIPVDAWVQKIHPPSVDSIQQRSADSEESIQVNEEQCPRINFLQFCRNDLRFGMNDYCQQQFLAHIYKRCCAVYAYNACPYIDAIAAASVGNVYIPVLMSMKTVAGFTFGQCCIVIDDIVKTLRTLPDKVKNALILIILLDRGSDFEAPEDDTLATPTTSTAQTRNAGDDWHRISTESRKLPVRACAQGIVSRIITVPQEDQYGLTDMARSLTGSDDDLAVYSSQSFIGSLPMKSLSGTRKPTTDEKKRTNEVLTNKVLTLAANVASKQKLYDRWKERETAESDNVDRKPAAK